MRPESVTFVDGWWAAVFGVDHAALWRRSSVQPSGLLEEHPNWFVAWRGTAVHVSAPDGTWPDGLVPPAEPGFWTDFARARGRTVLGPCRHAFLDVDAGPVPGVRQVDDADLASLRAAVSEAEWAESGFADGALERFALVEDGRVVAAANLSEFGGRPRDVGVLVAPDARGRGLATAVGGHAAALAVRRDGIARWRALTSNHASLAVAARLGFTPWCGQLTVR